MAKTLTKPFGRQIAKLKETARQANPNASPEALAEAVNKLAKDMGFDYTITPEKMGEKAAKATKKKRGRPVGSRNGAVQPSEPVRTIKRSGDPLEAAQAV